MKNVDFITKMSTNFDLITKILTLKPKFLAEKTKIMKHFDLISKILILKCKFLA